MLKAEKTTLVLKSESLSFWITDKFIYIMLAVFPLFTGFHGYTQVTLSKYIFFVAVTVLWIAAILLGKIKLILRKNVSRPSPVVLFILIYLFFCCISAVLSPYKSSVLLGEGRYDGLVTTLLCVSIFLGISVFARPKPGYIYAAAISMSINCIVAILQLLGYNPLYLFPGNYTYYDAGIKFTSIFIGTIGNADLFSAFLCLTLPMVSVYYITAKNRRLLLLPAIAISALCLFSCGVSGGILALAVCMLVGAPFVITNGSRLRRALEVALVFCFSLFIAFSLKAVKGTSGISLDFSFGNRAALVSVLFVCLVILRIALRKCEFKEKTLSYLFAGLSIGSVIAGLIATYLWHGTEGTIYELSQTMHGNLDDKFGSSRILIWRNAIKLVPGHLLLGSGPGTLPLRLNVNFSRFVAETGKTLSSTVDNAHNEYLGILVNTGLISLLSYMASQVISLKKAAKSAKTSGLCCCLACSLLCYWVQAFFGLGLFLVSPVMWLIWGLLVSSIKNVKT